MNKKLTKDFKILLLLGVFLLSSINVDNFLNSENSEENNSTLNVTEDVQEKLENTQDVNEDLNLGNSPPQAAEEVVVDSWWNNSYSYRLRFEVSNPFAYNIAKPIETWIDIPQDDVFTNSLRLVRYYSSLDLWAPIPFQLWNSTIYSGTKIDATTFTFVVQDLEPGQNIFYLYYDIESKPVDLTDYSSYTFTSDFEDGTGTNDNMTVSWTDPYGNAYDFSLNGSSGASALTTNGLNFHTQNSTAPGAPTTENLVGYWPFDGDIVEQTETYLSGDPALDYNIEGFTSGVIDPSRYQTGYYGSALNFDGSGDCIEVNSDENGYGGQDSTEGFTVMAWINPATLSGGEKMIASWDRSEYWRLSLHDYADSDGNIGILWATNDDAGGGGIDDMEADINDGADIEGEVAAGNWFHIAATFDPNDPLQKKIYFNGELVAQKSAHPNAASLGDGTTIQRYGFIASGSEDTNFGDGSNSPTGYFNGLMDELRIYNASLSEQDIQSAMNNLGEQSTILDIVEVETGPVFSQYNITWDNVTFSEGEMNITDTWTFYRSLNQWKVDRTYYWNFSNADLDSIALFNTFYNWDPSDASPTTKDYYYYDGNIIAGHDDQGFSIENYTVLHDYDNDNHGKSAIGLFISDIEMGVGDPYSFFNSLSWETSVNENGNQINFLVGNQLDMNNWNIAEGEPSASGYDWEDLYLKIEFWEFCRYNYDVSTGTASSEFENLYETLKTQLSINTNFVSEEVFYNYQLEVLDIDGLPVPNVNVSLYNYTEGPFVRDYFESAITDASGIAEFSQFLGAKFTVNLTYTPFADKTWLTEFNQTIDSSTVPDLENTLSDSITVNVTQLVIQFLAGSDDSPTVGAVIQAQKHKQADDTNELLGNKTVDVNGNITIWYSNFTADFDLNVSCVNYLGSGSDQRRLSDNKVDYDEYYIFSLDQGSYNLLYIQTQPFTTYLNLTTLTTSYVYNASHLINRIHYGYKETTAQPIVGANVEVQILDSVTEEAVYSNSSYGLTDSDGNITVDIDYTLPAIDLEVGKAYQLVITTSKAGFESKTRSKYFTIQNIPTDTDLLFEYFDSGTSKTFLNSSYWDENFTLSIKYFRDGSGTPVNDAIVTYEIDEIAGFNGNMESNGTDGWYTVELNSSDFLTSGNYSITITANKENYQLIEHNDFLEIKKRPTSITFLDDDITKKWEENFILGVQFEDVRFTSGIEEAVVTYDVVGEALSGTLTRNASRGSGWYDLELDTTDFPTAGVYFIDISAEKSQYVTQTGQIKVTIDEVPTSLTATEEYISIFWEENFTLSVHYQDIFRDVPISSSAIVTSTLVGSTLFDDSLESIGGGDYILEYNSTDFTQAGNYTFIINAERNQYEPKSVLIYLEIKTIPTQISSSSPDIEVYWRKEFTLSVLLMNISDGGNPVPITDATLDVGLVQDPLFTDQMVHMGAGLYQVTYNTTLFNEAGEYIFDIEATKNQFDDAEIFITVDILKIPINLTTVHPGNKIDRELNQNFVLSIAAYNVSLDELTPIYYASATYLVSGPDGYSDTGVLTTQLNGTFSKPFHTSTDFPGSGTYVFLITVSKDQYITETITITVNIEIIPTTFTTPDTEFSVYWEENISISVTYLDSRDSSGIDGTVSLLITGPQGFSELVNMDYLGSGNYEIEYNSTYFPKAGTYSFQCTASKNEYESQTLTISVDIEIVPTDLTTPYTSLNVEYGEDFTLSVLFEDVRNILSPAPITTATALYSVTGPVGYSESNLPLTHAIDEDGRYRALISTTGLQYNGTYYYTITVTKNQYETQTLSITIVVELIATQLVETDANIPVNWGEDFTLEVTYTDIGVSSEPITSGATISYTATGPDSFTDAGILSGGTNGIYQISFSATEGGQFVAGTYTYQIQALKSQHETQVVTITVNIEVIPTNLEAIDDIIAINYGDLFNVSVFYENLESNVNITTEATISYVVTGPSSYSDSGTLLNYGTEIYTQQFDSNVLGSNGSYTFQITATRNQYEQQIIVITVDIGIIPVNLTTNSLEISLYWEETVLLNASMFDIQDQQNPIVITDASVTYSISGSGYTDAGVMVYNGSTENYEKLFNTIDFGQAGTYTIQVVATKAEYAERTLVISLVISSIPTEMTYSYINESIDLVWEDQLDIQIRYTSNILGDISPIESGATLSYYAPSLNVPSGTLTYDTNGYYKFALDTLDFGETGTFNFRITATKNQYVTQQVVLSITVIEVSTAISTTQTNYTQIWGDEFTLTVEYDNLVPSTPESIADGVVSYQVGQQAGFQGQLVYNVAGYYEITLDTTVFSGIGSYTIYVTATKYEYETQTETFYLVLNPVPTKINGTFFEQTIETSFVKVEQLYYFNYSRDYGALTGITQANIAYFEWENTLTGDSGVNSLVEMENGLYLLDFDTEHRPISNYSIAVYIGKTNFVTRSAVLSLEILPREVNNVLGEDVSTGIAKKAEGNVIVIEFTLTDPLDGTPLTGANVTMTYRGKTYDVPETSTLGTYRYEIDTETEEYNALAAAITDLATITVTKANYTLAPFDVTISVTPPEFVIGNTGIPKIFVYIGGTVALLAIAIAGTVRYIKYANIPEIIKKIDKTKKLIAGNKVLDDANITKSKKEEMLEMFGDYWEMLDIDMEKILMISKDDSSSVPVTPGDIEGGEF